MTSNKEYFRERKANQFQKNFTIYEFKANWDDKYGEQVLSAEFLNKCSSQKEFQLSQNSVLMIEPYLNHDLSNSLCFWSVEYEKKSQVSVNPSQNSNNLDIYEVPEMHDAQVFFSVTGNTIFAAIQIRSSNSLINQLKLIIKTLNINCSITNVADTSSLQKLQDEGFSSLNIMSEITQSSLPVQKKNLFDKLFLSEEKPLNKGIAIGWLKISASDNPDLSISDPPSLMEDLNSECYIETKSHTKLTGEHFKNKYMLFLKKYAKNTVTKVSGFKAIEYITKKHSSS